MMPALAGRAAGSHHLHSLGSCCCPHHALRRMLGCLGHGRRRGTHGLGLRLRRRRRLPGVCIQPHQAKRLAGGGVCDARLLQRLEALNRACSGAPGRAGREQVPLSSHASCQLPPACLPGLPACRCLLESLPSSMLSRVDRRAVEGIRSAKRLQQPSAGPGKGRVQRSGRAHRGAVVPQDQDQHGVHDLER